MNKAKNEPSGAPNRLAAETSPYLLQHAYNPVDWYPWGVEALENARKLDRPIFLSVGYSSCHWCHVMERESFENPEIARLMNEHFINIKVDREERPDLDAIYMTAVQMLTGSGGWPMSVFLTPGLQPFWGGTYFPPSSYLGRPGFADILRAIAKVYQEDRPKVQETAQELTNQLLLGEQFRRADELPGKEAIDAAVRHALRTFDPQYGGFGPAPKFPRSVEISMLLRDYARKGDPAVLLACEKTLEGMARGGMYDQVGGGFHRYSTDNRWLVPHFEKMLYDNALLARSYLEAHQVTGNGFYRDIAAGVLDYIVREMRSAEGGFYSATDADSEGEEGKFFVWTPQEVESVVGREAGRAVCEWFNITVGGNFENGKSIPHITKSIEEVARALKLEPEALRRTLLDARQALYKAREERVKPFRDEKIITAWNSLTISALARASQVLAEERYLQAAEKAASFILERLYRGGRLYRTYKDGQSRFPAYLDDYAYLMEALIDLYETTFKLDYLTRAVELARVLLMDFWDGENGGFFFTALHHDGLICRKKDYLDNATPAANGVAALNLLRLERLTGQKLYRERAAELLKGARTLLERVPMAFGYTLIALDFFLYPPVEVAIVGDPQAPGTRGLLRVVHGRFLPSRVLAGSAPPVTPELARGVPLLQGKEAPGGRPAAYVCRDYACRAPVTEPSELEALLAEAGPER